VRDFAPRKASAIITPARPTMCAGASVEFNNIGVIARRKRNMVDLQETQHPSFRLPTDKDISIWRYMDLGKYLSMLDRRSLFLARATLLGDPFEGSPTKFMVAQREYVIANRATDPSLAASEGEGGLKDFACCGVYGSKVTLFAGNRMRANEDISTDHFEPPAGR
jgi:hypothetical protein